MAYKRIYLSKRNHIVIASANSVRELLQSTLNKMFVGEGEDLPPYPTVAENLRKKQEMKFKTKLLNEYELIELKNSRYKRSKV